MIWEYLTWLIIVNKGGRPDFELNERGKEGWELVNILPESPAVEQGYVHAARLGKDYYLAVFKRLKSQTRSEAEV